MRSFVSERGLAEVALSFPRSLSNLGQICLEFYEFFSGVIMLVVTEQTVADRTLDFGSEGKLVLR